MSSGLQHFEDLLGENVPLAPMTTLGIGGLARFFAEVTTTNALSAGVEWARSRGFPLFVLGGGSNIVVADSGFPGLVLRVGISGVETQLDDGNVLITAGAGEEWDALVAHCVLQHWSGFEGLSGIPGRVGATPFRMSAPMGKRQASRWCRYRRWRLQREG